MLNRKARKWKIGVEMEDDGHPRDNKYLSKLEIKTEIKEHLEITEHHIIGVNFKNLKIKRMR